MKYRFAIRSHRTIPCGGRVACWRGIAFAAVAMMAVALPAHGAEWFSIADLLSPAGTPVDLTPNGTQPVLENDILMPEPGSCSSCHSGETGDTSITFRPFSTWAGSMMANAMRDPVFWAALDVANNDVPGAGDYCLRCHTPRGWLDGRVLKAGDGVTLDPVKGPAGCLLEGNYAMPDSNASDFGGVTCHFCHRLMPQGPNGEALITGNDDAWVDDVSCALTGGGPCRRGPYDYTNEPPPHEWMQDPFQATSEVCGICHNVSTPDTSAGPLKTLILNDGTDTGHPFPIERTYAEWDQSSYAQAPQTTCLACHMPESEDPDATACVIPGYPIRTGNLPVHQFAGGNTWVPSIILGQYNAGIVAGGGIDRTPSIQQTIDWARTQLQSAANLSAAIQSYTPPGNGPGSLDVQFTITNLSGHKLPTGYSEGRRMWLNVEAHDANGALVFESAAYDAGSGVLTKDPQAHVYEVLQGIWNPATSNCDIDDGQGRPMFHFAINNCIAKDDRIPPLGFTPATADDPNGYDTRPVGYTYPETSPGSGVLVNYDTPAYSIPIPAGTPTPVSVTARLYYQTESNDYMEFLRNEAVENAFPAENDLCSGGPGRPFTVGPMDKSRGQYAYDLWNDPTASDRIFANSFDDTVFATGYGKSPPELMQVTTVLTTR